MIGIFDSGSGGLTVLKALRDQLPSCDVFYFGDTKNAPYGTRSQEELAKLTVQAIRLLQKRGANKIISACNSVSASLVISIHDALDLAPDSIIEMVGPTVSYIKNIQGSILLVATPATIKSGIYQNATAMAGKSIDTLALPSLAGAIERGESREKIEEIIVSELGSALKHDVLVLGCTHYPLVLEQFKKVVSPSVFIIDPAEAVADRAYKLFWPAEVRDGKSTFLISSDSDTFRNFVKELFPQSEYTIEVLE
jgi:glutamate racemase